MQTTGFICEFNPLHEGHRYFISQAREATDADCLVALMSGDFVQRGEPAILPMYERAKTALEAGADLVLQLPVVFSTGSAAYFAEGGVRILDALGCVDALAFGTESDKGTVLLSDLASFLHDHREDLQPLIRAGVSDGLTYAAARARAICENLTKEPSPCQEIAELSAEELTELLSRPNNQLALAYMTALKALGSGIEPVAIARGMSYPSSTEIRQAWLGKSDKRTVPLSEPDDFSLLLKDRLMKQEAEELSAYLDVTPDLARRIKNKQNDFVSWTQFTDLIHTKEMTRARVSRCLAHILLDIKKDDPLLTEGVAPKTVLTKLPAFVRVLGFRREAQPLLAAIKDSSAISVSTQLPADMSDTAADLYESVRTDKYGLPFTESHQQQPVIL